MVAVALSLALLLALPSPLAAQQDDRWQITLDQDRYVWDVRLVRLDGDSLVVRQADSSLRVPVERITELRLIRKSEMRLGDGAAAMSALTGRRRRGLRSHPARFRRAAAGDPEDPPLSPRRALTRGLPGPLPNPAPLIRQQPRDGRLRRGVAARGEGGERDCR